MQEGYQIIELKNRVSDVLTQMSIKVSDVLTLLGQRCADINHLGVYQIPNQSTKIQEEGKMEKAYKFLQLTLLGLIVGILIILLTQINYWAYDIKMTIRKSVVSQNNEKVRQFMDENNKQPPACPKPNVPKYKI